MRLPLFLFPLLLALTVHPWSTTPKPIEPVQIKVCPVDATLHAVGSACQFDNPTIPGDLIGVIAGMGSAGEPYPKFCSFVTDSQRNSFACANSVQYWNGIPIWYAFNTSGGTQDIIYFDQRIGDLPIIAEYPPATAFEDINSGTYAGQNISDCFPQATNCYTGWTLPIETDEPCELFLTWGTVVNGGPELAAGPDFTMRTISNGQLFLEDRTTGVPGLYFGSARWLYGNHWLMQSAAFRMGGCK